MTAEPPLDRTGDAPPGPPVEFLDRLGTADRAAFLAQAQVRPMAQGEVLFEEGQPADQVLVVERGMVKIWMAASSGRVVILNVLDAGAVVGELSAVDGGPRSAGATALADGSLLAVPAAAFEALLAARPTIALELLRTVAGRLRGASRRQLEFSAGDTLGRLCGALVELGRRYGEVDADGVRQVVLPLGQGELGSWGGLSREAVVKGLRSLRTLGWIEGEGRHVRLLDPGALEERSR